MYVSDFLVAGLAVACAANAESPLEKREEKCTIISPDGSTATRCRACPHLDCDVVTTVPVGDELDFSGWAHGDCYENNCTWDFIPEHKCYVNGYYTSSNCNHEVLPSLVLSTSAGSTATPTPKPVSTGTPADTSFGPTTSFNPAATATSAAPVQSTSTSGSSKGSGAGDSIGLRLALPAVASFFWYFLDGVPVGPISMLTASSPADKL